MDQPQWQTRVDNGAPAPPEILPPGAMPPGMGPEPGYGYQQPLAPPLTRARRPTWMLAPGTYVLLGINIAVYVLMVISRVSPTAPTALQLLHWGANTGLVRVSDTAPVIGVLAGEWWRLVTATFVHSGIIHLALNMWCLYNLGLLGEPLLGTFGVLAAYLLTGVMGNLLSIAVNPNVIGVGASGAVFGLAGVLVLLLGSKLLPVDRTEVKRLRGSVIRFAGLNFVLGFGANAIGGRVQIDNMAHLGGFLSGLLLGALLLPKLGVDRQRWIRRQWMAFGSVLLLVLLGAHFVASLWHV